MSNLKNLRARIEDAVVARLTAAKAGTPIASVSIVAGQTEGDIPDECVVVYAESQTPESRQLGAHGNHEVRVRVMVRTNANDTPAATHQERAEAVRYILTDVSSLRTAMTAQKVGLYDIFADGCDEVTEGDRFVTSHNYALPVVDNPAT